MNLQTIQQRFEQVARRVTQETSQLPGEVDKTIDSFSPGPPPDLEYAIFGIAIPELTQENDYKALASKLASYGEWAGRELSEDDVIELAETFDGIDPETFDVELYNNQVDRSDLDEWALGNGVTRIPPKRATGTILVFVRDSDTVVRDGSIVSAPGGPGLPPLEYEIQGDHAANPGETVVRNVPIEAVAGGIDHNVTAGAISDTRDYQDVTNPDPVTGGEPEETQAELRERARRALEFNTSGPTEQGVEGALYRAYEGLELDDIVVVPHRDPSEPDNELGYPYADVVVDGGDTDAAVQAFLDDWAYPITFRLVRPTLHTIDVSGTLRPAKGATASDIAIDRAENAVLRWLAEFGIGEELSTSKLQAIIHNADPEDIGDVDSLTVTDTQTGTTLTPGDDLTIGPTEKVASGTVSFTAQE